MNTPSTEAITPTTSGSDVFTAVRDTRRPYQKQLAMYLILASVLFERMAFYSLANNLVFTLRSDGPFRWEPAYRSIASNIFSGTSYISTLIFAIISDSRVGRAKGIIIGFGLYLIGYIFLTITASGETPLCDLSSAHHNRTGIFDQPCAHSILPMLFFTAIGAGGVKSNMAVFGAEQVEESKMTSRYFDKYIIVVNTGSIITTLLIPFFQDFSLKTYWIQYFLAILMVFIATLLFIIGRRHYIHVNPYHAVIGYCIPVYRNAFQSWRQYNKNKRSTDTKHSNSASSNVIDTCYSVAREEEEESIRISTHESSTFLDFAKAVNGGNYPEWIVDEVKSLVSAIFVFTLFLPYWLIYNQIHTTFQLQGHYMKWPSGKAYLIPWMSLGAPVTIIIGILIFDIFVYKYLNARNRSLAISTKFVIGMCVAVIMMAIAGIIESFRQDQCEQSLNNKQSSLTIYAQLPQYILMGFSEVFTMVTSYEFAYFVAPRSAQSLFLSLYFCSIGVSSFIGTAYTAVFSKISSPFDFRCPSDGKMISSFYTYFFILAGVQLIFIIIFIVCQKKFRIIKLNPQ